MYLIVKKLLIFVFVQSSISWCVRIYLDSWFPALPLSGRRRVHRDLRQRPTRKTIRVRLQQRRQPVASLLDRLCLQPECRRSSLDCCRRRSGLWHLKKFCFVDGLFGVALWLKTITKEEICVQLHMRLSSKMYRMSFGPFWNVYCWLFKQILKYIKLLDNHFTCWVKRYFWRGSLLNIVKMCNLKKLFFLYVISQFVYSKTLKHKITLRKMNRLERTNRFHF